ncbi:MAG: aminoglycoside phosphotransferase family protein [Deltaproteobacteria bacterium]
MEVAAAAERALGAWSIADAQLVPIEVGLINVTFEVRSERGRFILQRLNPIFSPRVHEDIEAVTEHLARRGIETPRLVRTVADTRYHDAEGVWRLMTFIEGETHARLTSDALAREAGALLGRFHRATADLEHTFVAGRLGVHDTPKHMRALEDAVGEHTGHRLHAEVAPLATEIVERYAALGSLPPVEDRVVHGDPKVSNVLFTPQGAARCLVDLDTLARMPIYLELGDALRSWCNPAGEDGGEATFSLPLFAAAIEGYASSTRGWLTAEESGALVRATATIILELAARFAADALRESYFGWNAKRFATRGDHNLLRAQRQLQEAKSLADVMDQAEAIVARAYAP